jgi:hypothetical protein
MPRQFTGKVVQMSPALVTSNSAQQLTQPGKRMQRF